MEESESSPDDSDGSEVDGEGAAAAPPVANGHEPERANGHAHAAQQSGAEHAQRTGRPPDVALVVADQAVQPEQQAQSQQDSAAGADVFIEHEPDPAKARALESSLWEVVSLRNRYCPQARHYSMSELHICTASSPPDDSYVQSSAHSRQGLAALSSIFPWHWRNIW